MVKELLALAAAIAGPAVLFINSENAVLFPNTGANGKLLPTPAAKPYLLDLTDQQDELSAAGGRSRLPGSTVDNDQGYRDLSRLAELRFACIVKPTRGTAKYTKAQFARVYKVIPPEQTERVCHRILAVVRGLVVQEWIEGPDNEIYFCYRTAQLTAQQLFSLRVASSPYGTGCRRHRELLRGS